MSSRNFKGWTSEAIAEREQAQLSKRLDAAQKARMLKSFAEAGANARKTKPSEIQEDLDAKAIAEMSDKDFSANLARLKKKTTKDQPEYKLQAAYVRTGASCFIGIDPGTKTGLAIKYDGIFRIIETGKIWWALNLVKDWAEYHGNKNVFVRVEDARLRTWFGKSGPEKWKGAGSIMRDCAIWEETLSELGIQFELVAPKHVKETTVEQFEKLTGWNGRTSIHAREAAWMII